MTTAHGLRVDAGRMQGSGCNFNAGCSPRCAHAGIRKIRKFKRESDDRAGFFSWDLYANETSETSFLPRFPVSINFDKVTITKSVMGTRRSERYAKSK